MNQQHKQKLAFTPAAQVDGRLENTWESDYVEYVTVSEPKPLRPLTNSKSEFNHLLDVPVQVFILLSLRRRVPFTECMFVPLPSLRL